MGIKKLFVSKELYIVTIKIGKEERKLVAKKEERVQFTDKKMNKIYFTVGSEVPENLKQYVTMELVTSQNKYKVKTIQKEMKNKNKK